VGLLELLAGHKKGVDPSHGLIGKRPGRQPGPRRHLGDQFFGAPQWLRGGAPQHIAARRARMRARGLGHWPFWERILRSLRMLGGDPRLTVSQSVVAVRRRPLRQLDQLGWAVGCG
jgi:hypothetical protein